MAGAKRRVKKTTRNASGDPVLRELDTLKRLVMLQLVGSGVKPIDIALTLDVAKSAISGLIPVRKLSIGRRQGKVTVLDVEATELTKRLDTLIALTRKNKSNG